MSEHFQLLTGDDGPVVSIENADGRSALLLVCEHASRRLPRKLGTLGLSADALEAHIAWDPGALAVAKQLSARLDATLIFQNFSRLVYDCNRPPEASDAMPVVSEVFEIPGNRDMSPAERQARVDEIYRPWQRTLADMIAARKAAGRETVVVTVHTYTPVYKGAAREVQIGILHDTDSRLADAMLRRAEGCGYDIRRNEPYGPEDGVTHTLREHGIANGLLNVMIEVRNDLVRDDEGQTRISDLLESLLSGSLAENDNTGGNTKADAISR